MTQLTMIRDGRALIDRIREVLDAGPASTDDLCAALPDVERARVVDGMRRLRERGVVVWRAGRWVGW